MFHLDFKLFIFYFYSFTVSDKGYTYDIGICASAVDATDYGSDVGVLQINKTDKSTKVVGRISDADIMAGRKFCSLG